MGDFASQAIATLLGALAAFGLEALRRKRQENEVEMRRFKEALFVLLLQRTLLRNLYEQHLRPMKQNPVRAYLIRPSLAVPSNLQLDLLALSFLLSNKQAQLLNVLGVAEAGYRTVLGLVEQRNELHRKSQTRIEAFSLASGMVEATAEQLRAAAGPMLARSLEALTDDLYRTVENAIGSNRECYEQAVAAYRLLYPKAHMFGVEDVPIPTDSAT